MPKISPGKSRKIPENPVNFEKRTGGIFRDLSRKILIPKKSWMIQKSGISGSGS
jgi:hypothetical protein